MLGIRHKCFLLIQFITHQPIYGTIPQTYHQRRLPSLEALQATCFRMMDRGIPLIFPRRPKDQMATPN